MNSIQSLYIEMYFNDTCLAKGTGFIAESLKGYNLITNRHNVTGRHQLTDEPLHNQNGIPNRILIYHNHKNRFGYHIPKFEQLKDEDEKIKWREHPIWGSKFDCIALPLKEVEEIDFYPYTPSKPGHDIKISPSDSISIIGFPFGIDSLNATSTNKIAIWVGGLVASEPEIDYEDLPQFLVDCRGRTGLSGSPVIAYRSDGVVKDKGGETVSYDGPAARFLGIYSGRINDKSDLGFIWKAEAIAELINSVS